MNWYLKVLNQYFDFNGRARREEFWMFNLWSALISISVIFLGLTMGITIEGLGFYGLLHSIYYLFILIPSFAVLVRRLHDVGKSGWMFFIILIPIIGVIWLFILLVTDSEIGENQYGENPKNSNNDNVEIPETVSEYDEIETSLLSIPRKVKLLEESFKSGLISETELIEKLGIIENEKLKLEFKLNEILATEKENDFNSKIEEDIKIDKEKLIELKNQGLLSDIEYQEKIDILFKKQVEINEKNRLEIEMQLEKEKNSQLTDRSEYLIFGGLILIILLFVAYRYFTSEF